MDKFVIRNNTSKKYVSYGRQTRSSEQAMQFNSFDNAAEHLISSNKSIEDHTICRIETKIVPIDTAKELIKLKNSKLKEVKNRYNKELKKAMAVFSKLEKKKSETKSS